MHLDASYSSLLFWVSNVRPFYVFEWVKLLYLSFPRQNHWIVLIHSTYRFQFDVIQFPFVLHSVRRLHCCHLNDGWVEYDLKNINANNCRIYEYSIKFRREKHLLWVCATIDFPFSSMSLSSCRTDLLLPTLLSLLLLLEVLLSLLFESLSLSLLLSLLTGFVCAVS